jgi:SRSO17 transposase
VSGTTTGRSSLLTLPDEPAADGFEHTLLIRRSVANPTQIGYFLVHAPAATPVADMVAVAGIRWRIEECNEQGKDLLVSAITQFPTRDGVLIT